VLSHLYSGRHLPQHLPSERGVSGHFSFWMQSVKAFVIWTTRATASAFRTKNVRALCLRDVECQGISTTEDVCHGNCLPDEGCQQIFPPERRVSRHLYSRQHVTRPLPSGRGVSGHFSFRMQSVKAFVLQTMRAMASVFQMSSVRVFFLPEAEYQGKCTTDDACHSVCLLDDECQGIFPSGCRVSWQTYYG